MRKSKYIHNISIAKNYFRQFPSLAPVLPHCQIADAQDEKMKTLQPGLFEQRDDLGEIEPFIKIQTFKIWQNALNAPVH